MFKTKDNLKSAFSPERQKKQDEIVHFLSHILNDFHKVNFSHRFWNLWLMPYANHIVTYFNDFNDLGYNPLVVDTIGDNSSNLKLKLVKLIKTIKNYPDYITHKKTLKENNEIHIGFPDLEVVDDDLGARLPVIERKWRFTISESQRELLINKYGVPGDVFYINILKALPKLYLEGFKEALSSIPLINPKNKIIHYHIGNHYMQMLVAKYIENGAKLYWYQHGAFYGELKYGAHVRERKISDVYRTWGWKIEEKDEPWKPYRLLSFYEKFLFFQKKKFKVRFKYLLCLSEYSEVTAHNINSFYKIFSNYPNKQEILVRKRPIGIFNKSSDPFDNFPFISTSGRNGIYKDILTSDLIITFQVPSTIFLECLTIDKPIVGFINTIDEINEMTMEDYNKLKKLNVLFDNREALYSFISSVNVVDWWAGVVQSGDYIEFKSKYINK